MSCFSWRIIITAFVLLYYGKIDNETINTGTLAMSGCGIEGSKLSKGVWYTVDMTQYYVPGYLTWTPKDDPESGAQWYVSHIFQLKNTTSYEKGGDWYESTQWEFLPSETYPGWYKMKNRRFLDCYLTWSTTDFTPFHTEKRQSNYVILESGRNEEDYMIKPILAQTANAGNGELHYHQLIMKQYPNGYVTWSRDPHNSHNHFIQLDHRNNSKDMDKYKEGGPWYEDTFFLFKPLESSTEQGCFSAGTIAKPSEFKLCFSLGILLAVYEILIFQN